MPNFTLYNIQGAEVGSVEQPALFETPVDQKLIHRYLVWVRTMLRATLSHTKTRGEVSGGGRKPWKQKGTGRARHGSTRSPQWRHGGVVFGPSKDRNWATRMPRAERRKALFSAMASKAIGNNVVVLDSWTLETPKTKEAIALMATVPGLAGKKVLHVHPAYEHGIFASTRNIPGVTSKTVQALSIVDLLDHDVMLMTKEALERLEQHFTPSE
jgi:large subunit ribosomal protein L4